MARRLLAVLTALLLVAAACNDDDGIDIGDPDDTEAEGVLIAAISGEPDRFDPHLTTAYPSFQVLENVYDTLVQPGDDLTMEEALATDWEVSDDNLTWTFTLREGVTWHNGRAFVADDVVYSYERIMDEEFGAANAFRFESIESVSAPDDGTVVIELTRPTPNLLANIGAFKGMAIVPEEIVEDGTIDTEPVGTGPFRFVEQRPDGEIVLERNPDYWGGDVALEGVRFRPIPDATVAMTNLERGEVHWTDSVPPQQISALEGRDDIVVESVSGGDYWYMAMNIEREPFGDVDFRRAVSFALDREAITEAALFEAATPNQTAIPEDSFFHFDYAPFEYDRDQAMELLEGTGIGDDFSMDLMVTNEFPETVTAAQVIADQLSEVGIDVQIRELDFAQWLDEQGEGNFDSFLLGWIGNIDPDDFYYAQHHSEGGFNFHGYSNPQVDELLDRARAETDDDTRKELYDEAVKMIVDEVSYLYLYNPDVVHAWVPEVSGYEVRADSAIRFENVSLSG